MTGRGSGPRRTRSRRRGNTRSPTPSPGHTRAQIRVSRIEDPILAVFRGSGRGTLTGVGSQGGLAAGLVGRRGVGAVGRQRVPGRRPSARSISATRLPPR